VLALVTALALAACDALQPYSGVEARGFLGDYSRLEPGAPEEAPALVFIDPSADFAPYDEVLIEPVTIWKREGSPLDVPAGDLERLVDRLEAALRRQLGQEFAIMERPGLRTLRLRTAIAEAQGAEAVLDVTSSMPPRAPAADPEEPLVESLRSLLARAAIEVEVLDALSNRRLAAAVDTRAAERALERPPATWGDVEEAWDDWADGVQAALAAFRRTALGEDSDAALEP
jgi:hypothetical protein